MKERLKHLAAWYQKDKEWFLGFTSMLLLAIYPAIYKIVDGIPALILVIFTWLPLLLIVGEYLVAGSKLKWMLRSAKEHFHAEKKKQIEYHQAMNDLIKK